MSKIFHLFNYVIDRRIRFLIQFSLSSLLRLLKFHIGLITHIAFFHVVIDHITCKVEFDLNHYKNKMNLIIIY